MSCIGRATVKARKLHRCYWCGEIIPVGNKYIRWGWADGGTVSEVKVHPECDAAWGTMALEWGGECEVDRAMHHRGCGCDRSRGGCECKAIAAEGD